MGNCLKKSLKKEEISKEITEEKGGKTHEIKAKSVKSWEKRDKLNKEDYQFVNKENEFLAKKPGFYYK